MTRPLTLTAIAALALPAITAGADILAAHQPPPQTTIIEAPYDLLPGLLTTPARCPGCPAACDGCTIAATYTETIREIHATTLGRIDHPGHVAVGDFVAGDVEAQIRQEFASLSKSKTPRS